MSDNWMPSTMAYIRIIRDLRYTSVSPAIAILIAKRQLSVAAMHHTIRQSMACLLCLCSVRCALPSPPLVRWLSSALVGLYSETAITAITGISSQYSVESKLLLFPCYWYNTTFLLSHGSAVCLRRDTTLCYRIICCLTSETIWNHEIIIPFGLTLDYRCVSPLISYSKTFSDIIFTFELFLFCQAFSSLSPSFVSRSLVFWFSHLSFR